MCEVGAAGSLSQKMAQNMACTGGLPVGVCGGLLPSARIVAAAQNAQIGFNRQATLRERNYVVGGQVFGGSAHLAIRMDCNHLFRQLAPR